MKRLFMVLLLITATFAISSCAEGDGMTGNILKQSLTASSKNTDSANIESTNTDDTKYSEEDTKTGWLDRVKATLQAGQRTRSVARSPSLSNADSTTKGGGDWILLRNTTEMHCLDADYNLDLKVTLPDFGMFATYYTNKEDPADLNYDGNVTLSDFGIFGSYYNHCDYTGNETTEYEYEIEIDDDYTINATLDTGVMAFTAWGQASTNTGFVVGNIETFRVLVEFPDSLGDEWGPIYYEDEDGDIQQAQNVSTFYVWRPQDYYKKIEVDYLPSTGKIEMDGDLIGDERMWLDWSNLTHLVSFEYFGQYEQMAESQELYMTLEGFGNCGYNGYYGRCDEDVNVSDYMVIRNPKDNFDNDEFRFSIYL
jgi:hypothetical protein